MILSGEIRPGERVFEVPVARRLAVPRSALREALRRLEGEGLLVADDAGGMRVIELDERELAATLELRAALEGLSAGLAARAVKEGREPRDLETLAGVSDRSLVADRHFHRAIAALSGNQPLRDALNHVWDRLVIAGRETGSPEEHRELAAAIASGDEDRAAGEMHRHLAYLRPFYEKAWRTRRSAR